MKKIIFAALSIGQLFSFGLLAADCGQVDRYAREVLKADMGSATHFTCQLTNQTLGQVFGETLDSPASNPAGSSSACILLVYNGGPIPHVLAQDSSTGFQLLKPTLSGNAKYGDRLIIAHHNTEADIMTRIDFDLNTKVAHLTSWEIGMIWNTMIHNYHVKCY